MKAGVCSKMKCCNNIKSAFSGPFPFPFSLSRNVVRALTVLLSELIWIECTICIGKTTFQWCLSYRRWQKVLTTASKDALILQGSRRPTSFDGWAIKMKSTLDSISRLFGYELSITFLSVLFLLLLSFFFFSLAFGCCSLFLFGLWG